MLLDSTIRRRTPRRPSPLAVVALATLIAARTSSAQIVDSTSNASAVLRGSDARGAIGFGLGALAALSVDHRLARWTQQPALQHDRALSWTATAMRLAAQPGVSIALPTIWGIARLRGDRTTASIALHGAEAALVGGVLTTAIKLGVGRARPAVDIDHPRNVQFLGGMIKGAQYRSFPSGHTMIAFAAASAITEETIRRRPDERWSTGIPLYSVATLVGLSRMYNNRHWASDVVGGAGIGTLAGVMVVRYNSGHPNNRGDRWLLGVSRSGGVLAPLVARTR